MGGAVQLFGLRQQPREAAHRAVMPEVKSGAFRHISRAG
jgi:hypothetical protein